MCLGQTAFGSERAVPPEPLRDPVGIFREYSTSTSLDSGVAQGGRFAEYEWTLGRYGNLWNGLCQFMGRSAERC